MLGLKDQNPGIVSNCLVSGTITGCGTRCRKNNIWAGYFNRLPRGQQALKSVRTPVTHPLSMMEVRDDHMVAAMPRGNRPQSAAARSTEDLVFVERAHGVFENIRVEEIVT